MIGDKHGRYVPEKGIGMLKRLFDYTVYKKYRKSDILPG